MRKVILTAGTSAFAVLLSGCGGSDGQTHIAVTPPPVSSSGPINIPAPATTRTNENFDTPEYAFSTSAKNSNVVPAWQAGATGKGVKIGIIDSGIATTAAEFASRIDPASRDFGGSGTLDDQYGHGTAVASIAAAAHDGRMLEGLAYDATLLVMKVAPPNCTGGCSFDNSDVAEGIRAAADAGAKVINLSMAADNAASSIKDAVRDAAAKGVIFVIGAGNDGSANPSGFAQAIASVAPGQTIIVGALGVDSGSASGVSVDYNQLWSHSDRAGNNGDWYIGAPGYAIEVAYQQGYDQVSGTSFAAPAVAGAIALMLQAFPNLTPQQIVQILLTTGADLGLAGVDSTFGHGRLDVGRAFQPIGETSLAGQTALVSLKNNGSAPAATGDALARGSLRAVVLDTYKRAFVVNLAQTLKTAPAGRPLASALAATVRNSSLTVGPMQMSFSVDPGKIGATRTWGRHVGPFGVAPQIRDTTLVTRLDRDTSIAIAVSSPARSLVERMGGRSGGAFLVNQEALSTPGFLVRGTRSFAGRRSFGSFAVSVQHETGEVAAPDAGRQSWRYRVSAVGLEKAFGTSVAALSMSTMDEDGTILGGRLGGPFGAPGAKTLFIDAELGGKLAGGWSITATGRHGWTRFAAGNLSTSSYSFAIDKAGIFDSADRLALFFSQPLRVSSGTLSMVLPSSYDYVTSSAHFERTQLSLAPHAREIVAEAGYSRHVRFGSGGLNVYGRLHPGHSTNARPDVGIAAHLNLNL